MWHQEGPRLETMQPPKIVVPIKSHLDVSLQWGGTPPIPVDRGYPSLGRGYSAIHKTKPQTLGFALSDSPVGLLAWLVEKFRTWTDCSGAPERALPRDEMITEVMLYWVSGCITSSMRLYYEVMGKGRPGGEAVRLLGQPITIPAGFARFPEEVHAAPRSWVKQQYKNVIRDADVARGGHFAAWEQPELLAEEIRLCFLCECGVDARKLCRVQEVVSSSRL